MIDKLLIAVTAAITAIGLAHLVLSEAFSQNGYNAIPAHVIHSYSSWRVRHSKHHYTPSELLFRTKVFHKNYLKVKQHNAGDSTYKLVLNHFADMTQEELEGKYLGHQVVPDNEMLGTKPGSYEKFQKMLDDIGDNIPSSIDWINKGAVTSVKDQKSCGSSWAFGAVAAIEGAYQIQNTVRKIFSEQYLIDCAQNGNLGCKGGLTSLAFQYVLGTGLSQTSTYPYTGYTGTCNAVEPVFPLLQDYIQIQPQNYTALLKAVSINPVSIVVSASTWFLYGGGIYNEPKCGVQLNHGAAIVGYDQDSHKNMYWVVKNSWGLQWGEKGYIRIARDPTKPVGVCGLLLKSYYVIPSEVGK